MWSPPCRDWCSEEVLSLGWSPWCFYCRPSISNCRNLSGFPQSFSLYFQIRLKNELFVINWTKLIVSGVRIDVYCKLSELIYRSSIKGYARENPKIFRFNISLTEIVNLDKSVETRITKGDSVRSLYSYSMSLS